MKHLMIQTLKKLNEKEIKKQQMKTGQLKICHVKTCDQKNGEISGYASVFNVKDGYNDITVKGAFEKSVRAFESGKFRPKLLWQHEANSPIGIIEELYEDEYGLFIKCRLLLEIEKVKEIYALLKSKAIDGFSIGYKIDDSYINENGTRFLTDINLLEVSIVTFPACKEATVENVKSFDFDASDSSNNNSDLKNSGNNFNNNNFNNERNNTMNNFQNEMNTTMSELNKFVEESNQEMKMKKISLPLSSSNVSPISSSNAIYQKAEFLEYIRNGNDAMFKKSLNAASGEAGGYFLPMPVVDKIYSHMKYLSPMRSICNVMSISTNSVDILVDSKNPDAGWLGEGEELLETDSPEIKKIKIAVHEVYAKPKANQKLLDDSQINIEDWLVTKISEKIARLENDAFINGNGTDKPKGFLNYATDDEASFGKLQHFKTGADGKFSDDANAVNLLIDMTCSIKPQYVKNAKWIMSRSALACVRKLRNQEGIALWQPSLSEATPSTLLGYPVIVDDNMPNLVEGTKSASIAFGDFYAGYQIVDRNDLTILRDPYTSKPFVEFYANKRSGGDVIDFDAIKVLKFED